ncbi:MAG: mechanosensitive ion channel [Bacteroidales bacterium]|nr:mechanosensitive ion channel [Bacteroidales bacterium]
MENVITNENFKIIIASVSFIGVLIIVFFVYRFFFRFFKKKVLLTPGKLDNFILDLFKVPALWLIYWVLLKIFSTIYLHELPFYPGMLHVNSLLLIFSIAWILIQFIKAITYYLQSHLDTGVSDNLKARKNLTQIKIFKGILNSIIIIIAISVALLTFDKARSIGLSLLTSAGVIGIIVGLAAQKSIGMILAGIQIAITQPIRLDDVVIVEGEWGRIEEITLTYVVVKIWDERRLVLPVNYFLEKPFQNWTRTSANISGTIFLYVDYNFPADAIRKVLPDMLKEFPDWDGRVANVQVTKASENYKEIRILLSSGNASKNWDLRVAMREKLIDFINSEFPGSFAKFRIKQETT